MFESMIQFSISVSHKHRIKFIRNIKLKKKKKNILLYSCFFTKMIKNETENFCCGFIKILFWLILFNTAKNWSQNGGLAGNLIVLSECSLVYTENANPYEILFVRLHWPSNCEAVLCSVLREKKKPKFLCRVELRGRARWRWVHKIFSIHRAYFGQFLRFTTSFSSFSFTIFKSKTWWIDWNRF